MILSEQCLPSTRNSLILYGIAINLYVRTVLCKLATSEIYLQRFHNAKVVTKSISDKFHTKELILISQSDNGVSYGHLFGVL